MSKQLFATESDMEFYRNRENNGRVYLNRRTITAMTPVGHFCCEVPDAANVNQTLCVFIGKLNIIISDKYMDKCLAEDRAEFL